MWHWLLQLLIFRKLGNSGFCNCYLQESITQWCMTMVMQTWYQLKAEELLLASTYDLGYEYVYLQNSWPLNFDYLFFRNTLYIYKFQVTLVEIMLVFESCNYSRVQSFLDTQHAQYNIWWSALYAADTLLTFDSGWSVENKCDILLALNREMQYFQIYKIGLELWQRIEKVDASIKHVSFQRTIINSCMKK